MRLLLVGGGPAGAKSAMQARELYADVTLLEAQQVGGTCLNSGPAPVPPRPGPASWPGDWSSLERFGLDGRSSLVHAARPEGRIAAWNAVRALTRQLVHDVVPSGSFTDLEYGAVGMTENQAAGDHDIAVGIGWYADLVCLVAEGHPDEFCKLIADRHTHAILGAHVLGEYSAETVQVVATARRRAAGRNAIRLPNLHRGRQYVRPEGLPRERHRAIPARLKLPRPPGMNGPDPDHPAEGTLIL